MDKEQAIELLEHLAWDKDNEGNCYGEALQMAIDALKQPEIITCGECRHYKPMSSNWGNCYVHGSPTELHRTCQSCDYCSWSERRTDD